MNTLDPIELQEAYDRFMTFAVVGLSPHTRLWYKNRLGRLVAELGPAQPLGEIDEQALLGYQRTLEEQRTLYDTDASYHPPVEGHYSKFTIHTHLRAVKRFFKWMSELGLVEKDPSAALVLPRLPKRGKKGIDDAAADAILEHARAAAEDQDLHAVRDYALLTFLSSTGCRRGGIADLRLGDLRLMNADPRQRRRVSIREKGDKERVVFLNDEAVDALEAWLAVRPHIADDHVFLGQKLMKGGKDDWRPLAAEGISGILKRYKEWLDISGRVSPHQWRHRFARRSIQRGMDIGTVSQIMGHTSIAVTSNFYAGFAVDELQDLYDRVYQK